MKQLVFCCFILLLSGTTLSGQKRDNDFIRQQIELYKTEVRGPYRDIRWFCPDGSYAMPKESCAQQGGVQRARYREDVINLHRTNHLYLGQILATTPKEEFWDAQNYNARLKQYQLEKYLRAIDDGWVLQKAQYYRGAYQIEDEETWGIDFFNWLLSTGEPLESQFFLVRQAAKDIPHKGDDNKTLSVRAVSKAIADAYPAFMDLRVKIHGQPEASDIQKVREFRDLHMAKLSADLQSKFELLITDMLDVYQPVDLNSLNQYLKVLSKDIPITQSLTAYISDFENYAGPARAMATAEKLAEIRQEINTIKSRKARLALIDLSNALEEIFFLEVNRWQPKTLEETTDKICYTGLAVMGTGFIEQWEWEKLEGQLSLPITEALTLRELYQYLERSRSLIEWGTGMVNGVYKDVVNQFAGFEPLAYGFYDDRIRGSVLLALGNAVDEFGTFLAKESKLTNKVLEMPGQSTVRGLNPGFAMGELVVVTQNENDIEVSSDKIYIFHHPPSDLKPVAGIMTVTEGNMVSHVQLLARNLGIPNSVLSAQNMEWLQRYSGKKIFYAVSNQGTVILKTTDQMTQEEKALFTVKKRQEERISVPIERIDLSQTLALNLQEVHAPSSGVICGPKAANLGELKRMFPENVVEGIVLPFGVFRSHMDQPMPGQNSSYWEYLNSVFQNANSLRQAGRSEEEIETTVLAGLEILREAIKKMDLLPAFAVDLDQKFEAAFGKKIGQVPVFLRSDTNMEDLKDFTGAGLNLTLFNVVEKAKIIQGIKEVWSSAYTERSFKWRQRYLLNPENVFPSILIIPSVDVAYSGVLITKGIPTADGRDLTIAFSRGAGGAVDGQAAESYLLNHLNENILLSPAREPSYRRLPVSGGSTILPATFEDPILNVQNLYDIRILTRDIYQKTPAPEEGTRKGPFDVELGFLDDHIWLFQIRPFVENKMAMSSSYLESISPRIDRNLLVRMDKPIK
ncbi:MAG: phosphoenolpyruvate synthase [Saprospiraceae bacterium]|nr:phosphoenolpyruvate synthase [Saprospiraceae bacterium]